MTSGNTSKRLAGWRTALVPAILAILAGGLVVFTFLQHAKRLPPCETSLDPSWMGALHYSAIHRLGWGRDVIYSSGPLGFLVIKQVWPETAVLVLGYRIFLALAFAASAISLGRKLGWSPTYIAGFVIAYVPVMRLGPDPLLMGLLLLIAVRLFFLSPSEELRFPFLASLILANLSLVKFTLTIVGTALVGLYVLRQIFARKGKSGGLIGLSYVVFFGVLWLLAGQHFADLGPFIRLSLEVTAGYGDAMSLQGPVSEVVVYVVSSAALLVAIVGLNRGKSLKLDIFQLLAVGLILFAGFKHAFVRHDDHAFIATQLGICAVVVYGAIRWRCGGVGSPSARAAYGVAVVGALVNLLLSIHHYLPGGPVDFAYNRLRSLMETRLTIASSFHESAPAASPVRANVRAATPRFGGVAGSTDIFSYDQLALFANGLEWRPRPAFQSNIAYTPELLRLNADRYLTGGAPRNVLFALEPIDGRYPALDDSLLWPILLSRYDVVESRGSYLLLRRSSTPRGYTLRVVGERNARFGEEVAIPWSDATLVWAAIEVRPTILGRVVSVLYKVPPITLETTTLSGEQHVHRLVRGIAGVGFLLSPLILSTRDFGALASEERYELMRSRGIRSIRVLRGPDGGWFYREFVRMRLSELRLPRSQPPVENSGGTAVANGGWPQDRRCDAW